MRKLCIMAILLLMVTGLIFATGASEGSDDTDGTTTPVLDKGGPFTKYDPAITVTFAKGTGETNLDIAEGTYVDNRWNDMLEEEYGIIVEYAFRVDGSQYATKLNAQIAAGNIPDVIKATSPIMLQQLMDSELIADLTDVYDKYATPFTKEQMASDGGLALNASKYGGRLMSIPEFVDPRPNVMYMRKDWLDNLGLTEPKTFDDLLKVADAFTNQDPDDDGKDDTIGFAFCNSIFSAAGDMAAIFNSFRAYPNQWYTNSDGEVVYGSVQPEMKEALTVLADLYAKGQIDKEFATIDPWSKLGEDLAAGRAGIVFGQWWLPTFPLQSSKDADPNSDWRGYPIVSADEDPVKVQYSFTGGSSYAVNKEFENPEVVVKLINIWWDRTHDGSSPNVDFTQWAQAEDGSRYFFFAPLLSWPGVDVRGVHIADALKANDPSKLNPEETGYYNDVLKYKDGDNSVWFNAAQYDELGGQQILSEVYFANDMVMPPAFYGAPTKTMADRQASLDRLEAETLFKIIMGETPIEEFDTFVEQWKKLGGEQITKEVNEWANK